MWKKAWSISVSGRPSKRAWTWPRLGNKYLADTEPWKVIKTDPERVKTILNISLQISANLTLLLDPFLPFSMEKLRGFLCFEGRSWDLIGRKACWHPDIKWRRLLCSSKRLRMSRSRHNSISCIKQRRRTKKQPWQPPKEEITFDDFTRMDLRTGTILEAEKVPKTKKLIKMLVDLGFEKRTIVSGIAEYYEPEALPGKEGMRTGQPGTQENQGN